MSLDLVFFDTTLAFDAETPYRAPLGGSQSAMAYLCAALAERGHRVRLLSMATETGRMRGVDCGAVAPFLENPASIGSPDAAILLNGPAKVSAIKDALPSKTKLILWTQHAHDQPDLSGLRDAALAAQWDHYVCVSNWQRDQIAATFGLDQARFSVLRNAVGPAFTNMFRDAADLMAAKSGPPLLVYTSTPFRGLSRLLDLWPHLNARRPDAELVIHSGLAVYQHQGDDPFAPLLARAEALAGVRNKGPVPPPVLAQTLKRATLLAYPNSFAETSCVAVMEALASGAHVVTSALGALPETTRGHAHLIPPPEFDGDGRRYDGQFLRAILETLAIRDAQPEAFAERKFAQVEDMNSSFTWAARAADWEGFLAGMAQR